MPDWLLWLLFGGGAGLILAAAGVFIAWRYRARPNLHVDVQHTGRESAGVTFRATCGNEGTAPAHGVYVVAKLGDRGEVYRSQPLDLPAGAPSVAVKPEIKLAAPELADTLQALNHDPTLYGEPLVVELVWRDRVRARDTYREPDYDPVTDAARRAAKLAHWREQGRQ